MSPIVSLSQVKFAWPGQTVSLHIEQLEIQQGDRVFIKGPSGSGKTTLLGLLGGVLQPQDGQVQVLDQSLEQISSAARDHFRSDHIGYIFQMFNLLPYLSVVENAALPCSFSKSRKQLAIQRSGSITKEALRLLQHLGLSDSGLLQRSVSALSIGQQQRVAAARALIGSPELIIADEPTSALDQDTRELFLRLLFEECDKSGATLLFVSHDHNLQRHFNKIIDLAQTNLATSPIDRRSA